MQIQTSIFKMTFEFEDTKVYSDYTKVCWRIFTVPLLQCLPLPRSQKKNTLIVPIHFMSILSADPALIDVLSLFLQCNKPAEVFSSNAKRVSYVPQTPMPADSKCVNPNFTKKQVALL